jgi:hypothetical protein
MMSPRFCGPGPHQRKHTFAWLLALATVLTVAPCRAQTTGGSTVAGRDSAVAVPIDTARTDTARTDTARTDTARTDTARTDTARTDTARTDTARTDTARTDTARTDSAAVTPGDTLPRSGPDSAARPPRPAPPPTPVDSALGAACGATAGGRPDLLLVTFRPTATESERSAVAQEVGGTVIGVSQHAAPGSWYLQVPGSAGDPTVADRLILLAPVLEVGATRCPS